MKTRTAPSIKVTLMWALSLAAQVALAQSPNRTGEPQPERAPVVPSRVERPLVLPTGAFELHFGAGAASSSIGSASGRATVGLGLHFESVVGIGRRFEVDGGFGVRVGQDGETLAADRYARVSREDVFQTGNMFLGNPYVRVRFAALDKSSLPLHIGVDAMVVFPVATLTDWSIAFGVPVHLVLTRRLRVEGGLFAQFVPAVTSTLRNVVNAPLRVNVAITGRVIVGVTTGIAVGNVGTTDPSKAFVPFGVQVIWRVQARTDLLFQWLYPAANPQGTDAVGFGIGLTAHNW